MTLTDSGAERPVDAAVARDVGPGAPRRSEYR